MRIRPARAVDIPAIYALLAPEIAAGTVLPRVVLTEEFLVAEQGGRLVGCVALKSWSDTVVELGALVAAEKGTGIGSLLVMAVVAWAEDRGYEVITALTAVPGFFFGQGFRVIPLAPHSVARGIGAEADEEAPTEETSPVFDPALVAAIGGKARKSCLGCDRLASCRQVLLALDIAPAERRRAVA